MSDAFEDLIVRLQKAMPNDSLQSISEALLRKLHPLDAWSTLSAPQVRTDKTEHSGAFVWCYYIDPRKTRAEPLIILAKRAKNRDAAGNPLYGALGGYVELGSETTAGEQPDEGAAREMREETTDDKGVPVLDIAPSRLQQYRTEIDYRNVSMPVQFAVHALALTKEEFEAISAHAEKIRTDPAYAAAVLDTTHEETAGFEIMPLSQALQLKPEQFAHPHELKQLAHLHSHISEPSLKKNTR